jgi:hypothetical protein
MQTLSVVAAAGSKTAEVVVNDSYSEPLNLFTLVVLPPANRKSAVFRAATAPLAAVERDEVERLAPKIAEAKARKKVAEARATKLGNDAVKARTKAEQERLLEEMTEAAREAEATSIPAPTRLLADDATAEGLTSLLADHGGKMAVMSAEGDVFDLMAGRYSGGANFNVYLCGHAGDDLRVDRVGRPPQFVRKPALTVGLAVQPEVLRGLAAKPGFRGKGLLGRFLYSLPESPVGRRDVDPPPVPDAVREAYHAKVVALLALKPAPGPEGAGEPHALTLSEEARRGYLDLAAWLEPRLAPTGELGHMGDWGGKLAGAVLRIAGNLHMADHVGERDPWTVPISGETMGRAVAIGQYLIPHARAAFGEMGADPIVSDAVHVLAWLRDHPRPSFSRRDLFEGLKGRFRRVDALVPVLELLEGHGYLRRRPAPERQGPGRPPAPVFEVSPYALGAAAGDPRALAEKSAAPIATPPGADAVTVAGEAHASGGAADDPGAVDGTAGEPVVDYEEGVL